jgi:hypothetical protein
MAVRTDAMLYCWKGNEKNQDGNCSYPFSQIRSNCTFSNEFPHVYIGVEIILRIKNMLVKLKQQKLILRTTVMCQIGDSIPGRGWEFFSSPPRPDRFWNPPSLQSNGYQGNLSLGVKRPGREADHSPPSSAEVKNPCSYISTPPIRLHGVVLS